MKQNLVKFQGFIIITLFVVPACSAVFEKYNALFSNKTSKNTCRLVGCSILNALNLENWRGVGEGIHNCALLLDFLTIFWLYCMHTLII